MNLFLEYFYQMKPIQIEYDSHKIKIRTKEKEYFLYQIEKDSFSYYAWIQGDKRYHHPILNQFQQLFSSHEGKYYVLCIPTKEKEIDILYPQSVGKRGKVLWREQWMKQSNERMEYYQKIQGKYPLIEESIDYYFGLWEMGIYLLKNYEDFKMDFFISHKEYSIEEFWNPFAVTIDRKEKDLGEYLKYLFWNHREQEAIELLTKNFHYDYPLVIARLYYPNFYWKAIDDFLENGDEKSLKDIVRRTDAYEKFIQQIEKMWNQKTSLWDEMF